MGLRPGLIIQSNNPIMGGKDNRHYSPVISIGQQMEVNKVAMGIL